uniref:Ubiquitin carboxyl-terminal hydrolase n=1 Tax=Hirondellea gigas TaxID=1518452 RepID=A0A6A7G987_9CRUS
MAGWCTIESDPGLFTELIAKFGVKGVQVEECYDLDSFDKIKPVYGLIFLFKWQTEKGSPRPVVEQPIPGLYFATQMISDACATQAILSILLNRPEIDVGPVLRNFRDFTMDFAPDDRGMALTNSIEIRNAHNEFKRPEPFVVESKKNSSDGEDAFHFITYIPHNGFLYELDGLQRGPVLLGECDLTNWLDKVKPHIEERIAKYSQSEIRFNLLGLIANRKEIYLKRIAELQVKQSIQSSPEANGDSMDTSADNSGSIAAEIAELQANITEEDEKFKRWKVENIRRKHNYVPFVFHLMKMLAEKDALNGLVSKAVEKWEMNKKSAVKS